MNLERITQSDSDDFILVNIVEELVRDKVDEIIGTMDMCHCKKCKLNACAIALNALGSRYVTTTKGALLTEIRDQNPDFQASVVVEVTKALETVKGNPLH